MKSRRTAPGAILAAITLLASGQTPAHAETGSHKFWSFITDTGSIIYLVAGTAMPLATDGHDGKAHTLRTVDSLLVSVGLSEAMKGIFNEQRPDKSDHESFPSGHATAAFTVAAMESAFHPRQAALWYGGAALIGASRVALHRHYVHDVIMGALLGYGTARLELSQRRGLILAPFIPPTGNSLGLSLFGRF